MKVLFSKKTIIILAAAIAIAAIGIVSLNTAGNSGAVTNTANIISTPLKAVVSSVARTFESIYGNLYRYDNIVAENEALKEQLAALRQDYLEYTEIKAENEQYRKLLGFSARYADRVLEQVVILQPGASNWTSTFTISKGASNSNIAVGNSIITESGVLIGRVIGVDPTTSTAISVIDTTFTAAVAIGDSGGYATAVGDFTLMRGGMLKLDRIPDDAAVLPGDTIITSGKGGVLPGGLTIGEIDEVFDHASGIGRYATIKPVMDIDSLTQVFVITDFDILD